MQIMETETNHQINLSVSKIKFDTMFCWKWGEPLTGKKPNWVIFRSPLSRITNEESSGYKYKESYHYPGLSQSTNIQMNLPFNPQLDVFL